MLVVNVAVELVSILLSIDNVLEDNIGRAERTSLFRAILFLAEERLALGNIQQTM